MLAQRRYGTHLRRSTFQIVRREQRGNLSGRRLDMDPTPTSGELRMLGHRRHVVNLAVRYLRGVQAGHNFRSCEASETLVNSLFERMALCDAFRVAGEPCVVQELRHTQDLTTKAPPFPVVLNSKGDSPVRTAVGTVGHDHIVTRARSWRR